jgi:hypothetical protein
MENNPNLCHYKDEKNINSQIDPLYCTLFNEIINNY